MTWDARFAERHSALASVRSAAESLVDLASFPGVDELTTRLSGRLRHNAQGHSVRFVRQPPRSRKPKTRALRDLYDGRIFETGEVPTREGSWHDLLNALAWATFPEAKAAINERQYRALVDWLGPGPIERLPGARTAEQDALAMLDEGGIVLLVEHAIENDLRAAHIRGDVESMRAAIAEHRAAALLLGHALTENIVAAGSEPVRGFGVILPVSKLPTSLDERIRLADAALAAHLRQPGRFPEGHGAPAIPLELAATLACRLTASRCRRRHPGFHHRRKSEARCTRRTGADRRSHRPRGRNRGPG